jgi:hypothetical protein
MHVDALLDSMTYLSLGQENTKLPMKSRKKHPPLVLGLLPPARCEELVVEWANLLDELEAYLRFVRKYPDVFKGVLSPMLVTFSSSSESLLRTFRDQLRKAWTATDAWRRDWYLFHLRQGFQFQLTARQRGLCVDDQRQLLEKALAGDKEANKQWLELMEPSPELIDAPIEAALRYLQTRAARRMLRCPNPDCQTYFLKSPTNPKQTSCSPECADLIRRATKQRWWKENRGAGATEIYRSKER